MKLNEDFKITNHALKALENHHGAHGSLADWMADQRYREARNHETVDSRAELHRLLDERFATVAHS